MKSARFLTFALLFLASNLTAATLRLGTDVVPTSQSIMLTLDPRKDDFTGSVKVDLTVKKATSSFRFHAEDLTITSLDLSGAEASFEKGEEGTVLVTTKAPLQPGKYVLNVSFEDRKSTRLNSSHS